MNYDSAAAVSLVRSCRGKSTREDLIRTPSAMHGNCTYFKHHHIKNGKTTSVYTSSYSSLVARDCSVGGLPRGCCTGIRLNEGKASAPPLGNPPRLAGRTAGLMP